MKRDGNHGDRPVQNLAAARAHQRGEPNRNRPSSLILQRVDDRSQDAVVRPDGPRAIDGSRQPPAAGTARNRQITDAPGREWIAAGLAKGRREGNDRSPAAIADGSGRGPFERFAAARASGREQHG